MTRAKKPPSPPVLVCSTVLVAYSSQSSAQHAIARSVIAVVIALSLIVNATAVTAINVTAKVPQDAPTTPPVKRVTDNAYVSAPAHTKHKK